ncbi:hypothetical protein F4780DRAFT_334258 [Xylariomycetidae sp. FL0641]|nr:hypothetical protein F4780DRAFT_334258 [Xylariomycetidae sp. FL0641]
MPTPAHGCHNEARSQAKQHRRGFWIDKIAALRGFSQGQGDASSQWDESFAIPRQGYHKNDSELRTRHLDVTDDDFEEISSAAEDAELEAHDHDLQCHYKDDLQKIGSISTSNLEPGETSIVISHPGKQTPRGFCHSISLPAPFWSLDGTAEGWSDVAGDTTARMDRHVSTTDHLPGNRHSAVPTSHQCRAPSPSLVERGQLGPAQFYRPPPRGSHTFEDEDEEEEGEDSDEDGEEYESIEEDDGDCEDIGSKKDGHEGMDRDEKWSLVSEDALADVTVGEDNQDDDAGVPYQERSRLNASVSPEHPAEVAQGSRIHCDWQDIAKVPPADIAASQRSMHTIPIGDLQPCQKLEALSILYCQGVARVDR